MVHVLATEVLVYLVAVEMAVGQGVSQVAGIRLNTRMGVAVRIVLVIAPAQDNIQIVPLEANILLIQHRPVDSSREKKRTYSDFLSPSYYRGMVWRRNSIIY